MLASVYNGVKDIDGVHVSMETVIQRILTGDKGLAEKTSHLNHLYQHNTRCLWIVRKCDLPAVTWSGTFPAGQRKAESLLDHSGHIVLDIDNDIDLDKVRSDLTSHPNVAFAFISPSGTGIKPVVRVDPVPQNAAEHKAAFDAVLSLFSEYAEQDPTKLPAQRDVCRLCFLAHDPTAIDRRDTASPVAWSMPVESNGQLEVPELETSPATVAESPFEGEPDPKALDFIPNDCDYPIWLTVGMAIKDAGLGVDVFSKWTGGRRKRSTGEWTTEDIPAHWNRYNGGGITWGSVVHLAKQNGYKPPKAPSLSNAERATKIDVPHNFYEKPVVMLSEVMETDDKPVIIDKIRDVVSDDVSQHLWKTDWIYRRGIFLGTLRRGEDAAVFVKSEMLSIGGEISRACALMKHAIKGIPSPVANPPIWLCADILYNQSVDTVREVRVVVSHPFFNGENLVAVEGYDVGTYTYLDSSFGVEMGEHTPESDLMLWKDLLQDFPFEDDSDFENAIGFALTLIVRQGLKTGEPVPLFDVTAAREGIGKSLLACTLLSAVIGYNMATDDLSSNREEIEKVVGGILLAGREAVVFDNVDTDRPLDSGLLASIITQGKRSVRPLGTSRMAVVENRATFCCTGSNVEIKPELAKRMVAIRLADKGIPEKDRKVKIEGIQDYVLENREQYLSALVRMVQRWIDADKPEAENTHRMRQWSRIIRGIMEVNGFGAAFLTNSDDVMLSTSPEFTIWSNTFKEIVAQLGDKAVEGWTAKDVFQILSYEKEVYAHEKDIDENGKRAFTRSAQGEGLLNELIGNAPNDQARRVKVGQLLRSKVGAVYGGFKLIDTHKNWRGAKIYALEGVDTEVDTGCESPPF